MINEPSLAAVRAQTDSTTGAVHPLHRQYGFAGLPWSIEQMLTRAHPDRTLGSSLVHADKALANDCFPDEGEGIERVILLFVDGFGWEQYARHCERSSFLSRVTDAGVVSKLTSLFPSTTCAHVSCVHSGLTPAESGLYEWFQYEPSLNAMIAPLLFSFAGDRERDTLLTEGHSASMFFRSQTVHERLAAKGVASFCVTPEAFTPSPFNDAVCKGSEGRPYGSLRGGLQDVISLANNNTAPQYIHYYFGDVDKFSHLHGPESDETANTIETFFTAVDEQLVPNLPQDGRTMVLVIADHGMATIDPAAAVYVNERCPNIVDALARDRDHRPLAPAGSPRDLFLHARPDCVDDLVRELGQALADVANVYATSSLIEKGLFGPVPVSEAFAQRIANVVILPFDDLAVWWRESGRFSVRHFGEHGGLSAREMEIPLLALRV